MLLVGQGDKVIINGSRGEQGMDLSKRIVSLAFEILAESQPF